MEKFARINSFTGKGMNEGYCFQDGSFYCETEEEAKLYVESLGYIWEEELKLFGTKDEWFYWTDWYETESDMFYDFDGNIIEEDS